MNADKITPKIGLSLSDVQRSYGLGRRTLAAAIERGELPAARLGRRRLVLLQADVERWIRSHAVRPVAAEAAAHVRASVSRALAREGNRAP